MDGLTWDGTLSAKDFRITALSFAQKWETLNSTFPPWYWVPCAKPSWLDSAEGEGYLSLEKIRLNDQEDIDQTIPTVGWEQHSSCSEKEDEIDDATLVQSNHHELHYYDFHIVYSYTFKVPVLYLRAYCNDGQPLSLDEIDKDLPACSAKELSKSKWTFIAQEEHPYLRRPWYKLHPCGTSDWMKLLFISEGAQPKHEVVLQLYLLSWFSAVGQVVGLRTTSKMLCT